MVSSTSTASTSVGASFIAIENAAVPSARSQQSGSTSQNQSSTRVQISREAVHLIKAEATAVRQANMSPSELKDEAERLLQQITLQDSAAVERAYQEVPDTADPQLIERAMQANQFFKKTASNPFSGLPHAKLSSTMFDDSGAYTINERRAARDEIQKQRLKYWNAVFADSASKSDQRGTFRALLDTYDNSSALEKAANNYPSDYRERIHMQLNEENRLRA